MGYYAPSRRGNKEVVESLYASLSRGDTAAVAALLAEDVDWRFHGPRRCQQHMRRLLTGDAGPASFRFAPARVTEVGGTHAEWVVAEGWGEPEQLQDDGGGGGARASSYWVHAWMLHGGVVTRCREYVNTAVTVRELGLAGSTSAKDSMGHAVWRSQPRKLSGRSMPGLVLAI